MPKYRYNKLQDKILFFVSFFLSFQQVLLKTSENIISWECSFFSEKALSCLLSNDIHFSYNSRNGKRKYFRINSFLYLLSSDWGADKIALCFFFTSSTFACMLSIISRMSSTTSKNSSMNPSRPSTLTATSSGPPSSSSLWAYG